MFVRGAVSQVTFRKVETNCIANRHNNNTNKRSLIKLIWPEKCSICLLTRMLYIHFFNRYFSRFNFKLKIVSRGYAQIFIQRWDWKCSSQNKPENQIELQFVCVYVCGCNAFITTLTSRREEKSLEVKNVHEKKETKTVVCVR